jgi:Na+/melibiose symporter-like transporter
MRRRQWVAYLACSFSIGVFSAFNNFTLTLWLSGLTSSYLLLGLLGNTRSFEGTFVSPTMGFFSDRTWLGWLGRRRPFILIGGLLSALLLSLTPALSHLPLPEQMARLSTSSRELILAVAVIFLFTLTFNAMSDIHAALLVDITSESERNRLSALRVVVSMGGQVAILILGFLIWRSAVPDSAFPVTGLLIAAGIVLTVLFVHEPPPSIWAADRLAVAEAALDRPSVWDLVRRYRGAAVLCLVAFCYWSGVNAVLPLISIYVRDILHATTGQSQLLPAFLLVSTTVFALPMAKLGNRYGKRKIIGAGYLIIACSALTGLFITTKEQGAIVFIIAGAGSAASEVLMIPLLSDLVPRRHIGVATGLLAGSGSVAAPASSLVAGHLADLYGPRIIFLVMSITVIIALCLLPFARPPTIPASELHAPETAPGPHGSQSEAVPEV